MPEALDLVKNIISHIVDYKDDIEISISKSQGKQVIDVSVHPFDLGRLIGRYGRTANAIRDLLNIIWPDKYRLNIDSSGEEIQP